MRLIMRRVRTAFNVVLVMLAFPGGALADGPSRREVVQEQQTAYIWVVGGWGFEMCRILTDDLEHIPQPEDIRALCSYETQQLFNDGVVWVYYLGKYHYIKDVLRPLPEIQIQTDFAGSAIIVQAFDPLPDQSVYQIDGWSNSGPLVCDTHNGTPIPGGLRCEFSLYKPGTITFYASSTFGDRSRNTTLRIGNKSQSNTIFSDSKTDWIVIGESAYTQHNPYHDIYMRWGLVPGADPVPEWARTVPTEFLISDQYYYYLSGQILLGDLSAGQNCPNNGISRENGQYATNCGVHSVFERAFEIQNAYNDEITDASQLTGVPNRIIKQIIAVESQFYPNAFGIAGERGLYQFTRDGADTLLRWNGPFYVELCLEYWGYCNQVGYDNLDQWQQDVLINHVLFDHNNIYYLASAIKANAYQVARIVNDFANTETPGDIFTIDDLWKLTILNYHAGPTVTSAVLVNTKQSEMKLSWGSFANVLRDLQPSALEYVNRVYRGY